MGYELKPRTATFVFDEEPYAGLEVELRINPQLADIWRLAAVDLDSLKTPAKIREFLVYAGSVLLISWNLTSGGEPVPATADNFADKLDLAVARSLIRSCVEQIGELSGPLALTSSNGNTSRVLQASRSQRRSPRRSSSNR
jgi:hypothetical protein